MSNPAPFILSKSAQAEINALDKAFGIKPEKQAKPVWITGAPRVSKWSTSQPKPRIQVTRKQIDEAIERAIKAYGTPISIHKAPAWTGQLPSIRKLTDHQTKQYVVAYLIAYEIMGKLTTYDMQDVARDMGLFTDRYTLISVKKWLSASGLVTLSNSFRGQPWGTIVSFNV